MPIYLKQKLFKPFIYLLSSILLLGGGSYQLSEVLYMLDNSYRQERSNVNRLHQQLRQTVLELALVQRYQHAFDQLKRKNMIGEKARADWLDRMMELVAQSQAKNVSFEFKARADLSQATTVPLNAKFIRYENVRFKGSFQHELNALDFIQRMKRQVEPLFLVDQCAFELVEKNVSQKIHFAYQENSGNITLSCSFYLLELRVAQIR